MADQPTIPSTPTPLKPVKPKEKKWLLWGLIGFTVILLSTALVLFFQLKQPAPLPSPRPKVSPSPVLPEVKETTTENVCELSFEVNEFDCTSITLEPTGTEIGPADTRKLTSHLTGGSGSYSHSWTITSTGSNKGSLSSTTTNPTTWTAPSSLTDSQTWTIKDTVTDTSVTTQTATCEVELSYGGLTGCFDTCEDDQDCEGDLSCKEVAAVKRCVNPDCQEDADCRCPSASGSPSPSPSTSPRPSVSPSASPVSRVEQPTLPQAGINTPLVLGASAGVLMMLLGLLFF